MNGKQKIYKDIYNYKNALYLKDVKLHYTNINGLSNNGYLIQNNQLIYTVRIFPRVIIIYKYIHIHKMSFSYFLTTWLATVEKANPQSQQPD